MSGTLSRIGVAAGNIIINIALSSRTYERMAAVYKDDKRDESSVPSVAAATETLDAILTINNARNQSLAGFSALQDMVIESTGEDDNDVAYFHSEGGLDANGTMSGWSRSSADGLVRGRLSFWVRGLDSPMDGSWVAVDRSRADDGVERAFDHAKAIATGQATLGDLEEVIEILTVIEEDLEAAAGEGKDRRRRKVKIGEGSQM